MNLLEIYTNVVITLWIVVAIRVVFTLRACDWDSEKLNLYIDKRSSVDKVVTKLLSPATHSIVLIILYVWS